MLKVQNKITKELIFDIKSIKWYNNPYRVKFEKIAPIVQMYGFHQYPLFNHFDGAQKKFGGICIVMDN